MLDTFFYCVFLGFILHSVLEGVGNSKNEEATWSLKVVAYWVFCYILRDVKNVVRSLKGHKNLVSFRFGYDLTLHVLLSIAIVFKVSIFLTQCRCQCQTQISLLRHDVRVLLLRITTSCFVSPYFSLPYKSSYSNPFVVALAYTLA